jgi:4-diphosphocytidyl-2-C-methyl-D-erythritol kinase
MNAASSGLHDADIPECRRPLVSSLAGWVCEPAPAKINLHLAVTGKREDGYHLLDSLAIFAGAHDLVHAAHSDDALTLELRGPFAAPLTVEPDNLVLRAAKALADWAGRPPLAKLWRLQVKPRDMHRLALSLGADVPVCLDCVPRRMGGIGDVLTSAPALPPYGLALVNPGVAVSTAEVFRARMGPFSADPDLPVGWVDAGAMARRLSVLSNDLEHAAVTICPEIGLALDALRGTTGCLLARMSGSGATCFALYETASRAVDATARCAWPGWWRWGGAPWSPAG